MESKSLGRGIQQGDVWTAADALIAEGQRPTIERVRQKIGRGSPNTVSPMLDAWFATLGQRLSQGTGGPVSDQAGNPASGLPPALLQAVQTLWEATRQEAARTQTQQAEALRRDIELKSAALLDQQAQLQQRELAFETARASLDGALGASRQALESAHAQLSEAHRLQESTQGEIRRLRESQAQTQAQAQAQLEALRREHRAASAARDEALKAAETRHTAREHRLLGDIDRERLATRETVAELIKEQKLRSRGEDENAGKLQTQMAATRAVETLAHELRAALAAKSAEAVQLHAELRASRQAHDESRTRLAGEERAHEATRGLLASALAEKTRPDRGGKQRFTPAKK